MSAAAPLPPPPPGPPGNLNGFTNGAGGIGTNVTANPGSGSGSGRSPGGSVPSIAEITASAMEKVHELSTLTIGNLLRHGQDHFASAKAFLERRNSAAAYWEYLVAVEIATTAVPNHPQYRDRIVGNRGEMHRQYKELTGDIRGYHERFMSIKQIIANENKRNAASPSPYHQGTRPSSTSSQYTATSSDLSQGSRMSIGSARRRDDELMLPDVPSAPPDSSRRKPHVQPKPQSLHGRALHQSTASNGGINPDDLAARFQKLTAGAPPINTSVSSVQNDLSVKMPSPADYQSTSRPLGPREMPPPPPSHGSSHLPKLPLDTQLAASMPKEPSPTYSPARNLSTPANINPPRSSARSIVGTGGRSNSIAASSISSYAPNPDGETDSYFPSTSSTQPSASRRKSIHKPQETQITAERLYDYIRMYNVLLIDVRNREEFDSGHIYARSILCIEPTALQDGCSAEQLQDRLVLSPEDEQVMFARRNEYDLVVYYDEATKTNGFIHKHMRNETETALKRLYDTLYEFNEEKPLQRPPIFLMGGIDAWTDLMGSQSLKMSSTVSVVASGQAKPSRGIRRAPPASSAARLNLHRRRIRDYAPIEPEEEKKLREEALKGRRTYEPDPLEEEEDDDQESPMYRTTEEFLRHFPDVEAQQQSMMYPPSRPAPPVPYVAPPLPAAPSRPPPSVPRVSYSGVHERQLAAQGRTPELAAYISPGRHRQIRMHRTGLKNFGVTCYMNSIVQSLCANMELSSIFLSGRFTQDIQKRNWKGSRGLVAEAYATLISNLFKDDAAGIRPTSFRKICGRMNSQWEIDEQQDAKEFLEFLVDFLHEDMNTTWEKAPLKPLTEAEEQAREALPRPYVSRIEWGRYLHRDNSIIGNLFAGQHASRLTCTTCGNTSTTYEAFLSISVEIPRDRPGDIRECLRSYCMEERLSGDDIWRCPRCKKEREAMKKITITRAPQYLVMHFKRFSASRTESARKVRSPIHFPLQGLDLGPYMEPPISEEQEAVVLHRAKDAHAQLTGLKTDPAMTGPYIYNAYAVVHHIGMTLGSGHYIAHVRDKSRGCWRRFNDEAVVDYDPSQLPTNERLQSEKAYIVFYERERVSGGVF